MTFFSCFNVNFNIAEASGYFPKSWIQDGVYARSCPPKCPSFIKAKDDKDNDKDQTDKIFQIDMKSLLQKLDDKPNLARWEARQTWKTNNHKKYVEEQCPSFKDMKNRDTYDNMEQIVKKLEKGNFIQ